MDTPKRKSYWTGKISDELIEMPTDFLPPLFRQYEVLYVEAEHEQKLRDTLLWFSRSMGRIYSFFIFGILGCVLFGIGYPKIGAPLIMLMGFGFFIYPLTTGTTIRIVGLRESMYAMRFFSVFVICLGFTLTFWG